MTLCKICKKKPAKRYERTIRGQVFYTYKRCKKCSDKRLNLLEDIIASQTWEEFVTTYNNTAKKGCQLGYWVDKGD